MTKLTIPIEPKPQTRPKFSKWGTYEDPKMKAWRKQCTGLIEANYDGPYFDGPVSVDVIFYMPAPQTMSKQPTPRAKQTTWDKFKKFMSETIWHDKKIDLDNLIKAVFDSISNAGYDKVDKTGIVWKDDSLVSEIHARKIYSPNPRIEMEITDVRNDD